MLNNLPHNNPSVKYNSIGQLKRNKAQIDNEKIDSHIRYSLPTEKIIGSNSKSNYVFVLYFLRVHIPSNSYYDSSDLYFIVLQLS